jgi:hypothetical protein
MYVRFSLIFLPGLRPALQLSGSCPGAAVSMASLLAVRPKIGRSPTKPPTETPAPANGSTVVPASLFRTLVCRRPLAS